MGQKKQPKPLTGYHKQFELREDNDFLHFTDRYYSTGTFLGLRKLLTQSPDSLSKSHFGFYLFQEIYTPADLEEPNYLTYERPFAGFLGFSNELSYSNPKRFWNFNFVIGVTGPISGAEFVQSSFHSTAAEGSRVATWNEQIENNVHANFYLDFVREWKLLPNPFSVHFALNPKTAFGTRDLYLQNDAIFYFGKRSSLQNSIAYKQLGHLEREFFFAVRLGYRYLFHDSLIEGHIISDSSTYLLEPYHQIFFYNFELFFRRGRNDLKLTYNFETPRTFKAEPHLYISFTYARSF